MAERNIETQGSKKLKQYIEDLLRNKHFLNTVKKLMATYGKMPNDNVAYNEVKNILKEYKNLDNKASKYDKKYHSELSRLTNLISEDYGLNMELLRPVLLSLSSLKEGELLRISMTKSIKNIKTKYRHLKLKCLNTQKQILITKLL